MSPLFCADADISAYVEMLGKLLRIDFRYACPLPGLAHSGKY